MLKLEKHYYRGLLTILLPGHQQGPKGRPSGILGPGSPQCWVLWSPRSKRPNPQGISGGRRRTGQRTLRSAPSDGLASALQLGLS